MRLDDVQCDTRNYKTVKWRNRRITKGCRRAHCSKFCNRWPSRCGRPVGPADGAHVDFIHRRKHTYQPSSSSSYSFFHYRFLGAHASLSRCQVHNGWNTHAFAPHLQSTPVRETRTLCIFLTRLPQSRLWSARLGKKKSSRHPQLMSAKNNRTCVRPVGGIFQRKQNYRISDSRVHSRRVVARITVNDAKVSDKARIHSGNTRKGRILLLQSASGISGINLCATVFMASAR